MSYLKQIMRLPWNDPKHRDYRERLWMGGPFSGCLYYFSVLIEKDCSGFDQTKLQSMVRDFIAKCFGEKNAQYVGAGIYWKEFVLPCLKNECQKLHDPENPLKFGKEEQAFLLLLEHPDWNDEKVRENLKTTEKAMSRWGCYNAIRADQKRRMRNI